MPDPASAALATIVGDGYVRIDWSMVERVIAAPGGFSTDVVSVAMVLMQAARDGSVSRHDGSSPRPSTLQNNIIEGDTAPSAMHDGGKVRSHDKKRSG